MRLSTLFVGAARLLNLRRELSLEVGEFAHLLRDDLVQAVFLISREVLAMSVRTIKPVFLIHELVVVPTRYPPRDSTTHSAAVYLSEIYFHGFMLRIDLVVRPFLV
jgi:hypothetical protein